MIIGKSLTALGGGGLKPEIIVTAKEGALLNLYFKNSSIILQSYQLGASETTHTFVVSVSETAYVVEDATNGESVEVLVDAVAQYNVDIEYKLWLYRDGDECEDVTGGWNQCSLTNDQYSMTATASYSNLAKEDNSLVFSISKNNVYAFTGVACQCVNKVDLTLYSKIFVTREYLSLSDDSTSDIWFPVYIGNNLGDITDYSVMCGGNAVTSDMNRTLISADITNLTGSFYIYIGHWNGAGDPVTVKSTGAISKIWLEE